MFDWLKHKEYPEFWKEYLSKFSKKSNRYVVLSVESTGLNPHKDVITYISAFAVVDNNILIGDNYETILLQYKFLHDNELSNKYIIDSTMNKLGEPDAIISFIVYIGNSVLVGHKVDSDVEMINAALERLECGKLKNEALDIEIMHQKLNEVTDREFTIEELSEIYKLPQTKGDSSTEKAYKTALLFLKLKTRLGLK